MTDNDDCMQTLAELCARFGKEPQEHVESVHSMIVLMLEKSNGKFSALQKKVKRAFGEVGKYNVSAMLGVVFANLDKALREEKKDYGKIDDARAMMFACRTVLKENVEELGKLERGSFEANDVDDIVTKMAHINDFVVDRPQRNSSSRQVRHAAPRMNAAVRLFTNAVSFAPRRQRQMGA